MRITDGVLHLNSSAERAQSSQFMLLILISDIGAAFDQANTM